jgi:hypothetical protein
MLINKLLILIVIAAGLVYSQTELHRISQANRVYFISEIDGLTANIVNPAGLSIKPGDDGFLLSYDFVDFNNQGNSFASFSMGNFGFSYEDLFNYQNIRLQNYAFNLSIGGEFLAIATSNKLVSVSYPNHSNDFFSVDAGIILRPAKSVSLSFVARNLSEPEIDSLDFSRNYTAGIGIFLFNDVFRIFGEVDFNKNNSINKNAAVNVGIVLQPVDILELRASAYRNLDGIYEGVLAASFLIDNSFRIMVSTRLNESQERTRYSAMIVLPLQTVKF